MGRLFYPKPFIESDARLTLPQRKDTPEVSLAFWGLKSQVFTKFNEFRRIMGKIEPFLFRYQADTPLLHCQGAE
uniref:Uncharacterized protein n=1 Tax=Candidatus Kentrum sp. FM TaxID=2126340 RepID=A0A450WMC3_9GAMM|nr:MAG: hypothetical protein BECKFM1743A_GA0114220_102156 [Candidatus Kentron sp. FM]VFJ76482.1 MAG: hypothetical protein BECKFM1743C_GA0114222_109323 [Candidatus Kentron sp. FM]VFK18175.1 MAG: hypothetical protein BECKFM1743B_GA0114221_105295 [Candidatus Kentron sp. FM]